MEDEKIHRDVLLKVYDAAINEYRFNVQLLWDRTKFFLGLNSGLIAAGIGLLKFGEDSALISFFLIVFFLFSICIGLFGLETVGVGKRYYREANFTKTLVERELGLLRQVPGMADPKANLSIAVTVGQRRHLDILFGKTPLESSRFRFVPVAITEYTQAMFWMMTFIEVLGAVVATANMARTLM